MNPIQKLIDAIDELTDEARRRTLDDQSEATGGDDDPDADDHDDDDADGDEDAGDDRDSDGDGDDDDRDGDDEDRDSDGDDSDDDDSDDSDGDVVRTEAADVADAAGEPDSSETAGAGAVDDGERDDDDGSDPRSAENDADDAGAASNTAAPGERAERSDDAWAAVDSVVEKTLYGVCETSNGVYAVGASGTVARRSPDGSWSVVVPSGPAAKRNTLTCVTATEDRERIWFAGSSGSLGMYDTTTGRKYDYSAPMEKTSTWEAIGIAGQRGEERLVVANGSGEVMEAAVSERFCPSFDEPVKPGSGSTIPALDVCDDVVYTVDTSGNVFERRGAEWTRVGIENAQINFTDVDASADGSALVSGGGGIVYRYDVPCENWTPIAVGTVVLRSIDRHDEQVVAVGDGGRVYERDARDGWTTAEAETESTLHGVALGQTDVAVGEGGTVVERPGRRGSDPEVSGA